MSINRSYHIHPINYAQYIQHAHRIDPIDPIHPIHPIHHIHYTTLLLAPMEYTAMSETNSDIP